MEEDEYDVRIGIKTPSIANGASSRHEINVLTGQYFGSQVISKGNIDIVGVQHDETLSADRVFSGVKADVFSHKKGGGLIGFSYNVDGSVGIRIGAGYDNLNAYFEGQFKVDEDNQFVRDIVRQLEDTIADPSGMTRLVNNAKEAYPNISEERLLELMSAELEDIILAPDTIDKPIYELEYKMFYWDNEPLRTLLEEENGAPAWAIDPSPNDGTSGGSDSDDDPVQVIPGDNWTPNLEDSNPYAGIETGTVIEHDYGGGDTGTVTVTQNGGGSTTLVSEFTDGDGDTITVHNEIQDGFGYGPPIALDLDGDGIEVTFGVGPLFDWDGDGYLEKGSWIGGSDAFLVIDLDENGQRGAGDGQINHAKEIVWTNWLSAEDFSGSGNWFWDLFSIFGLATVTDLQALSILETKSGWGNNNNVLDSADEVWNEVRVWQDLNQNGKSDDGELKTLAEWGITEVSLSYDSGASFSDTQDDISVFGNTLNGTASFTHDGSVLEFGLLGLDGYEVVGGVGDVALEYERDGIKPVLDGADIDWISEEDGTVAASYFDIAKASSRDKTITGNTYSGVYGDSRANTINASGATHDLIIDGGDGNDSIFGGTGNDQLIGGEGSDRIDGGDGDDTIVADFLDLLSDTQAENAGLSNWGKVRGGAGTDTLIITGDQGVHMKLDTKEVEIVYGSAGHDRLNSAGLNFGTSVFGRDGDDSLYGGNGGDFFFGGNGADRLDGKLGNDQIYGDGGTDNLWGSEGNDSLYGGDDADIIKGGVGDDLLSGDEGNDRLYGESGNDSLYGGGGNDTLRGDEGDDYALGGDGDDTVYGNDGSDLLRGGNDDDILYGGAGEDQFRYYRHKENDVIKDFENNIDTVELAGFGELFGSWYGLQEYVVDSGHGSNAVVFDFGSNDTLTIENTTTGYLENDVEFLSGGAEIVGTDGVDTLNGSSGADAIYGDDGADRLSGGSGDDLLYGGEANDNLYGGDGSDYLVGGNGNDYLRDDGGSGFFYGGSGIDTVSYWGLGSDIDVNLEDGTSSDGDILDSIENVFGADAGNDSLTGNGEANLLRGLNGNDHLYGGGGNDTLRGDEGDDYALGGDGNDTVYGNDGSDLLRGGNDDDILYGGAGEDQFRYYRHKENDVIKDFENNIDTVELAGFGELFGSWEELQTYVVDTGHESGNVVFDFGSNDTLTIENTTTGYLENDLTIL